MSCDLPWEENVVQRQKSQDTMENIAHWIKFGEFNGDAHFIFIF